MTPVRLHQIRRLYEEALEQDPGSRSAFVDRACGSDSELRDEVQSMLAVGSELDGFLAEPAFRRPPDSLPGSESSASVFAPGAIIAERYTILHLQGIGGMGEVYRAEDRTLNRTVALKVLRGERIGDANRRRSLVEEARAASALNHPHIATIYDFGTSDGLEFITMEFVEGQSLDNVIPREGLKVQDALRYGAQIAEALAAAHASGVVHRDVKPGNVMVASDGVVKVLDFGLAKLAGPVGALETSITEIRETTAGGAIVGTVSYMSPEQAQGKTVDARSDIFSFGSVLYEMLTGRRPFEGESKMATLAAVLRKEPASVRELAPGVPAELERVVMRCLRKDPLRRFQHMDDVKVAVQELREESDSGRLGVAPPRRGRKWRWFAAGAAALVSALLLTGWWYKQTARKTGELELKKITNDAGLTIEPALSSDGKLIAYASDRDGGGDLELWVQQVAGGDPVRLTNNEIDDHSPVFSPDSTHIAFRSERGGGGIYMMSALGGQARLLIAEGRRPQFSPDGKQIAFWTGTAIIRGDATSGKTYIIPVATGSPRRVGSDFAVAYNPIWSSDGSRLLLLGHPADAGDALAAYDWWVVPVDGGPPVRTGAWQALRGAKLSARPFAWHGDYVLFNGFDGEAWGLWRAVLRQSRPKFDGPPERLTNSTGDQTGASFNGTGIAFSAGEQRNRIWMLPADTVSGRVTGGVKQLVEHGDDIGNPSMSLDGSLLAYRGGAYSRRSSSDIFLKRLDTGETKIIANMAEPELRPKVLPDGSAVLFEVHRSGERFERMAFRVSPAGGDNRKLCDDCGVWGVSPDGDWLVSRVIGKAVVEQCVYQVSTGNRSELLRKDKVSINRPDFSNDGKWLVFQARESPEGARLYVAPFKGLRPIAEHEWVPLTSNDWKADTPRWSPDDCIIYFTAERDGYRCIYGQHVNRQTKAPEGEPFPVYHAHSARQSLLNALASFEEISIGREGIAFVMGEVTGNVWLATLPQE